MHGFRWVWSQYQVKRAEHERVERLAAEALAEHGPTSLEYLAREVRAARSAIRLSVYRSGVELARVSGLLYEDPHTRGFNAVKGSSYWWCHGAGDKEWREQAECSARELQVPGWLVEAWCEDFLRGVARAYTHSVPEVST